MRTISYKLDDLKKAIIRIGYVGENQHTQVRIDCKDLFKEYPDAAVNMAIVSPAGQSYPKVATVDGSTVVWDVTDSDLAAEGDGEIQLTFTEGGVVAKTAVARFNVYRSITAEGPAPDPVDDWLQEASEALEDIEAAEVNQPVIGQDGYWYTWDQEAGEYVKTSTKAQGPKGDPGQGADVIDDTTPAQDKTYSSSKIEAELTPLKSDLQDIEDDVALKIDKPSIPGTQGQVLLSDGSGGQAWGDVLERQSTIAVNDGIIEMKEGSGGGSSGTVMELIETVTTSEAKTNIKLEFDKLTEFVLIMEIPAGAGSGNVAVKINGTQYRTMGSAIASGNKRYLGVRYGYFYPFVEYLNASNDGASTSWSTLCSAAGTYNNYQTWISGFTSLEFVASSSNIPFPSGTIVKLYGREAAA